jgi:hypothetical protein
VQIKRLKRSNFFAGKMLSAEHLLQEQEYHVDKHRRQNRFLHGWGVVSGLEISIEGSAIEVSPGFAIDCAGNDLVVESCEKVALPEGSGRHYVVIRYEEIPVEPVAAPSGEDCATEFSRILESARIELASTDPAANHRGMGPGTPGCGKVHPLRLAILEKRGTRWRVESTRRR